MKTNKQVLDFIEQKWGDDHIGIPFTDDGKISTIEGIEKQIATLNGRQGQIYAAIPNGDGYKISPYWVNCQPQKENDTSGIIDLEEWKKMQETNYPNSYNISGAVINESKMSHEAGDYLAQFVEGFMNLKEFRDDIILNNRKIYIYDLRWVPGMVFFYDVTDPANPIALDEPKINGNFWVIRYGELQETQ